MHGAQWIAGRWATILPVALTSLLVSSLDQATKHWVRTAFFLGQSRLDDWPVRLRYVENSGSAFGLFPDETAILIPASIIAMAILVWLFQQTGLTSLSRRLSLGLMLGGGTSNLIDRIRFGSVTDFIDFRVWPIFNVADSSVVIGIAILIIYMLLRSGEARRAG